MDQIDIQTMTWHIPYQLDTWHSINVTRDMNNLKKIKNEIKNKIKDKKFKKMRNW